MRSRNRKETPALSVRFGSRRQKKGSRGKRSSIKGWSSCFARFHNMICIMQDSLVIKPPKKCPLVLWMAILGLIMISGVYICSLCLKLRVFVVTPNQLRGKATKQTCHDPRIPQSELHYMHYPEPTTYSRKECTCTPVRFFAILSMQRSGSGWFETLLNSHVNVSSNGEIFSVKERRINISSITETLDKVYNLDWYSSASKNECTAAVGLKWMLNQGLMQHHKEIIEYFNKRGVSAILLFRRNLLRRLVSVLANSHDRNAKQLNGTHKAHVHSKDEADVLSQDISLRSTQLC
ncbi:unnamed protein product [Musa textilis]